MNDSMHRVIILDKLPSPYIKQAIIVLNSYDASSQSRIIREAEAVVSAYIDSHPCTAFPSISDMGARQKKSRPKNGWLISFSLLFVLVLITAVFFIIFR